MVMKPDFDRLKADVEVIRADVKRIIEMLEANGRTGAVQG
jgi:hypothetical protein